MANSDKNIVITPNIGQTDDPKIVFSGADASTTAQDISVYAYPTNNGTLSFEGSAGQLFSITNSLTGTIFSVNDVSGIPSIEVDDDGTIRFAEFVGNILIGTATDDGVNKLQVVGDTKVTGDLDVTGTITGTITGTVTGTSDTANKWTTARTITLAGVLSGSVSIDGSANVTLTAAHTSDPVLTLAGDATGSATFTNLGNATLTVAVVDDSHSHSFNNLINKTSGTGDYTTTGTMTAATFNATSTTNGGFQGIDADTALLPSFTWTSDLNTGMWHAAADQIGFTTGGTNRLTISTTDVTSTLRVRTPQLYVGTGSTAPTSPGSIAVTSTGDPYISWHATSAATRGAYMQYIAATDRFLFGEVAYTETTGSFRAPAFYDTSGTTYYLKPSSALTAQSATAGSYLNDLRINTLWQGGVPANAGPIRTYTLTSGGTLYTDGTYTNQVLSGGQGVYATFDFTVVGGIVTVATLTERGSAFQVNNTLAIPALGGTGSGGLITVNTVDTVDVSLYGATPRIRLGLNDTTTAAGQEIGTIYFNTRDASAGGAGDKAFIRGVAGGTSGGGEIEFWTSANGAAPTLCAKVGGSNDFRLYNTAGTFYHAFNNAPTANRTITLPDVTGTAAIIQTAATAGYFDTSTTTPTGTTRLNYGGYFYPTFINLAGSGDTATTATHYFVETGSDGFVRPKTLANVRTEIVTNAAISTAGAVLTTTAQSIAGVKTFSDATASTSKTLGAVVISGGLGVGGAINAGADVTAYAASDRRLKTNIENIPDALAKVNQLNGVTYNWNELAHEVEHKDTTVREVGVIAQEINEVLPEVINVRDNGYMAVRYEKIVPLLIEAIKEQQTQIDELRAMVQKLLDK